MPAKPIPRPPGRRAPRPARIGADRGHGAAAPPGGDHVRAALGGCRRGVDDAGPLARDLEPVMASPLRGDSGYRAGQHHGDRGRGRRRRRRRCDRGGRGRTLPSMAATSPRGAMSTSHSGRRSARCAPATWGSRRRDHQAAKSTPTNGVPSARIPSMSDAGFRARPAASSAGGSGAARRRPSRRCSDRCRPRRRAV